MLNLKKNYTKILYIFFIFLSLNLFFFSTGKAAGKVFEIKNIEISKSFEIDFNKNNVIDQGFREAFSELILLILNSSDQKNLGLPKLNELKEMVESFSIKQEKFIDEIYYVNLGVNFNKKKVLNYLEKKNIFPSIPIRKKILFVPIIIEENKKDVFLFSNNKFFSEWNLNTESFHLIDYILPTEDLEDLNLIKKKYEYIEQYDFKEITEKYDLKDSIVALIFKNQNDIRILSRIDIKDNVVLKNQTFSKIDLKKENQIRAVIGELKFLYEDHWKNINQINTSIKLPINIMVNTNNNDKISKFEKNLDELDLIYDFFIIKFDKDYIYYQIIFNSTPNNFLKTMKDYDFDFDTQNKIWRLK
tara:strand:- start:3540 stop:4616 length:1077 start_codon:yes stop_codon:yes gene_type:complete